MTDYTPDPTTPVDINIFNYPIETPEAKKFWSSDHKCNIAKAFISFCLDQDNYEELGKRHGYSREWRDRAWAAFGIYVNDPDMLTTPFTEIETPYWVCMPNINEGVIIDSQPMIIALTGSDSGIAYGSSFTMNVSASGTGPLSYQWNKDGTPIGGATSTTYNIPAFTEADNGMYSVTVTNTIGSVTSPDVGFLTVIPLPIITLNPVDLIVVDGDLAVFTADALNYDTVSWYENNILLAGETTTTLSLPSNTLQDGNRYFAKFTRGLSNVNTSQAKLVVNPIIPTITLHPLFTEIDEGDTLTLTADATVYDTVSWFKVNRLTGVYSQVGTGTTYNETGVYTGFFDAYYAEFYLGIYMTRTNIADVFVSEVVAPPIPPITPIYHWDETSYTSAVPPAVDSWTDNLQGLSLLKIGTGLLSQVTVNSLPAMESFTDGGLQTAASLNIPTDFSVVLVMGMTRYSLSDFSFATDSFSGTARVTLGVSQDNVITASNGFGTVLFDALKDNVDNQLNCYVMTAQAGGNFITYQNDEMIVEITSGSSWAFGSLFANAGGASNRGTNGIACEMLIYDTVLSATQRTTIVDSLITKWGLGPVEVTHNGLPVTHNGTPVTYN